MSGGGIDYAQFKISTIINDVKEAYQQHSQYEQLSPKTIDDLQYFLTLLQLTEVYAGRFDYLFEGDDSEDSFHKRLQEDLENLELCNLTNYPDDAIDVRLIGKTKKVKMKFKKPIRMEYLS